MTKKPTLKVWKLTYYQEDKNGKMKFYEWQGDATLLELPMEDAEYMKPITEKEAS